MSQILFNWVPCYMLFFIAQRVQIKIIIHTSGVFGGPDTDYCLCCACAMQWVCRMIKGNCNNSHHTLVYAHQQSIHNQPNLYIQTKLVINAATHPARCASRLPNKCPSLLIKGSLCPYIAILHAIWVFEIWSANTPRRMKYRDNECVDDSNTRMCIHPHWLSNRFAIWHSSTKSLYLLNSENSPIWWAIAIYDYCDQV